MAETISTATPKAKAKPVAVTSESAFEMPKFEMPKFDMPNVEMPAAFRELAEKGIAQAKDNYEKIKSAAEQAPPCSRIPTATPPRGPRTTASS